MIWLIILESINGLLNGTQSSEPLDGDDNASADNMGACADCVVPDLRECAEFPNFKTLTQDRVCWSTRNAGVKSCPFDPAPTSVTLQVLDVLLPVITCMNNMSFESGLFAEKWRQALVSPTLKKCGIDIAYINFRPLINLSYVSKLSGRAAPVNRQETP